MITDDVLGHPECQPCMSILHCLSPVIVHQIEKKNITKETEKYNLLLRLSNKPRRPVPLAIQPFRIDPPPSISRPPS